VTGIGWRLGAEQVTSLMVSGSASRTPVVLRDFQVTIFASSPLVT
jgi:hypothetical protein